MSTTPAVMMLLERKVPLTLLLDLADPEHLPSRAILRREAGDTSWLRPRTSPERQVAAARPS